MNPARGLATATLLVVSVLLSTSTTASPVLSVHVGKSVVVAGDLLTVEFGLSAPSATTLVDLYVGVLIPPSASVSFGCPAGDAIYFFASGGVIRCRSAAASSFPALFANVPFVVAPESLMIPVAATIPPGTYTFFVAATRAGALADGHVDGDDLLAIATADVVSATLSAAARQIIIDGNQSPYGAITRWVTSPILVAAPNWDPLVLEQALDFWRQLLGIQGVEFERTTNVSGADIVFRIDAAAPLPPGACGSEGPTSVHNHVIEAGSGVYLPVCPNPGGTPDPPGRIGLAHGIGHILGLLVHTPSGSDLMGSPVSTFALSPLLAEVMLFLYGVAPGTIIP